MKTNERQSGGVRGTVAVLALLVTVIYVGFYVLVAMRSAAQ